MIKTHNIIILLTERHKHTLGIVYQGNVAFSDKEFKAMCRYDIKYGEKSFWRLNHFHADMPTSRTLAHKVHIFTPRIL